MGDSYESIVEAAANEAARMIREEGRRPKEAIYTAASFVGVAMRDVAVALGRRGGRVASARKRRGQATIATENTSEGNTDTGESTNG